MLKDSCTTRTWRVYRNLQPLLSQGRKSNGFFFSLGGEGCAGAQVFLFPYSTLSSDPLPGASRPRPPVEGRYTTRPAAMQPFLFPYPHFSRTRCHAGVAALLHTFLRPAAWGSSPQSLARGLLHDSPLDSRVQGLRPLTPEPPQTSCKRCHVSLSQRLLPRAHGVCRLPKAPPPALSSAWSSLAPLRSASGSPGRDNKADGG